MSNCTVCGKPRSLFIMNNRTICMKCDELLFDIEIECEEEAPKKVQEPTAVKLLAPTGTPTPIKK